MKKMVKAAALLAAMALAAGLTACHGKGSSKGLVIDGATVTGFTPDVPAKLVIPQGVSKIGNRAFKECLTLTSVTIPDTVTKIGALAFFGCKNLKSVKLSKGVTYIENNTFDGCTSLASVTIPDTVTSISYCAFIDCTSLKEVKYAGTKAQWEEIKKHDSYMQGYTVSFTVHCKDGDVAVEVK